MSSHMFTQKARKLLFLLLTLTCFASLQNIRAYTVTNLSAAYHNGQVFFTWTNPNVSKLQYNIYRGTSQFTSSSQLTSVSFLGFVRDSSSKNIRLSQIS